ncbi:leucine-rich repeat domain-containing protein [Parabacteroides sp.]
MKKNLQKGSFVVLAAMFLGLSGLQAANTTVELTKEGTLAAQLGAESKSITDLTVKGPINAEDFATLLAMGQGNLKSLDLSDALPVGDSIPSRALVNAKMVESLVLPKTTARIGSFALAGLAISSIELPAPLEYIGDHAFRNRGVLATLTLAEGNKAYSLVDGILYSADKKRLILCPSAREGAVTVADGVTRIENSAFDYCLKIASVKLPASVEELGDYAFSEAKALVSVNLDQVQTIGVKAFHGCGAFAGVNGKLSLPKMKLIGSMAFASTPIIELETGDALESIGENAFWLCEQLTKVTLGKNIQEIGKSAFHADSQLLTVYCYAEVPPVMGGYNAFNYTFEDKGSLYVPKGTAAAYKSASVWKQVKNIQEMGTTTGIDSIDNPENLVAGVEGGILVSANAGAIVRVFNAAGVLVKEQTVAAGSGQISLVKGIYYVSLNKAKAVAVLVK